MHNNRFGQFQTIGVPWWLLVIGEKRGGLTEEGYHLIMLSTKEMEKEELSSSLEDLK